MRSSSLLGRAFSLRDRGRLEEALASCREALAAVRDPRVAPDSPFAFNTIVVGALTIDEIATRLRAPDLARGPLEHALRTIEQSKARSARPLRPDKDAQLLIDKERQIRQRLDELRQ